MAAARRPTLARVAELAGVSVSTASLAFSGAGPITPDTRGRVLQAARQLGYAGPNPLGRQLRSGRSGIVGVVIGDQLARAFSDPVAIPVLDGLVSTLGEHGLGVLLIPGVPSPDPSRSVDPLIETAAMDVAVLVWGIGASDATFDALCRRGVPVVIGEGRRVPGVPLVGVDDAEGTAAAVEHLLALGHSRIAEITLPLDQSGRSGPLDGARLGQVQRAPTAHRLRGVRARVEPVASWEAEASLVEQGRAGALALLAGLPAGRPAPGPEPAGRPAVAGPTEPGAEPAPGPGEAIADRAGMRPTAIVAHSDLLAAGALLAARDLGLRVPEDLSITGFDGLDLPWLAPDVLTSVHQPLEEKGAALGRAAINLLAGEEPEVVTLGVRLVVGSTTGPAPR